MDAAAENAAPRYNLGYVWLISLVAAALLFAVSSVLTGWASSFSWFVAFRILGGVAIGMASNLSPMYIAEVAPAQIRGRLVSTSALWIACFILTYTFPLLNGALGPARTFWLYPLVCAAGSVFIFLGVPETKGKTLEQIERELVD
jgi:MFS family permease